MVELAAAVAEEAVAAVEADLDAGQAAVTLLAQREGAEAAVLEVAGGNTPPAFLAAPPPSALHASVNPPT